MRLRLLLVISVAVMAVAADSVSTKERTVTELAPGVYFIRHPDAPDTFPQSNTTVVIGDRDVLVVDSCYMPSSAKEDIAQIKRWTKKPVTFLVNTHWHYDHTMGNGIYAEEFPNVQIVAQLETKRQSEGYNPGWFKRYPERTKTFEQEVATGKDPEGKPLDEDTLKDLRESLAGRPKVQAEFDVLHDRTPNVSFVDELDLDLGGREVQIKHLGRGNTAGDAIVYLPKEKIVVAGDLLDHPVPYLGGGYPWEEIETLKKLQALDAQTIVPGHGEVLHDKVFLGQVIDLLQMVTNEVSRQIYAVGNGAKNLEPVKKAVMEKVDFNPYRDKWCGEDKECRGFLDSFSINGVITAAWAAKWGR
jgi:glyoxylase-like metal-dependent hydrolase (beta-lactamase superfamily II)